MDNQIDQMPNNEVLEPNNNNNKTFLIIGIIIGSLIIVGISYYLVKTIFFDKSSSNET